MISVEEAKSRILEEAQPLAVRLVPLSAAGGLTLAETIYAKSNIPAFEQSSMDGYAFRFEDHLLPLTIQGEMQAGTDETFTLLAGQAARIFTGAPLPLQADTVVMQEKVNVKDGVLRIEDPQINPGSNVRKIGSEVSGGALAMQKGSKLSPAAIGFLAGIGEKEVPVYPAPKVGIIVTGKELQQPGNVLAFGQVYESNSYSLSAALKLAQIREINLYTADDDLEELAAVLETALQHNDLVLLTGGVSVGDYDFVLRAATLSGISQVFHKVKQKPGKPLYFGKRGEQLIFGLPGNPSSVLSCFYQYVLPAVEKLMNCESSLKTTMAELSHDYRKPAGLSHFIKAWFENGKVTPLNAQESFRMSSFAVANCMIELEEEETLVVAGSRVKVYLFPG